MSAVPEIWAQLPRQSMQRNLDSLSASSSSPHRQRDTVVDTQRLTKPRTGAEEAHTHAYTYIMNDMGICERKQTLCKRQNDLTKKGSLTCFFTLTLFFFPPIWGPKSLLSDRFKHMLLLCLCCTVRVCCACACCALCAGS